MHTERTVKEGDEDGIEEGNEEGDEVQIRSTDACRTE